MSVEAYNAEIKQLGLEAVGPATTLILLYKAGNLDLWLPQPQVLNAADRAEALDIIKKTLGVGLRPRVG